MAIKVILGKVQTGKEQTFETGEVITGLSEQDEVSLVKKGIAEYVLDEKIVLSKEPEIPGTQENSVESEKDEEKDDETVIDFNPEDTIVSDKKPVKQRK